VRPARLPDERLDAEDGDQGEAFGVLGAGFGRLDHDAQVAARDGEDVAVQGDRPDLRMVDGLARGLVLADHAGIP
jgi:hypothetical protein